MAALQDGIRTATVRSTTPAKVAGVTADELDAHALSAVASARGRDRRPVGDG